MKNELWEQARALVIKARRERSNTIVAWRIATDPGAGAIEGDVEHAAIQCLRERDSWGLAAIVTLAWLLHPGESET